MGSVEMQEPFLPLVLSDREVGRLHEQLAEIQRNIHKEGSTDNTTLLEHLPVAVYERVRENFDGAISDEVLEEVAEILEGELHARTKMEVVIAVPPTRRTYTRIASWAQTLAKPLELTVTVDATIIGGAIVLLDGRVFDRSLKHALEKNEYLRTIS